MTKKEICQTKPAIAYYSAGNGIEIHNIEYGIDDYIIFTAGAWGPKSKQTFHRCKLYSDKNGAYFMYHGCRCRLNECIRMGGN